MMVKSINNHVAITLKQLLASYLATEFLPDIDVLGLTLDSRCVEDGFVFVALEGKFEHGLAYAEVALNQGAAAILYDADCDQYCQQILSKLMPRSVCVPIRDLQNKLGEMANQFYAKPSEQMFVTGITGTDGKTSVSHFIAQAMNNAHGAAAVIGTLGNGAINTLTESMHTTPDVIRLHAILADLKQQDIGNVSIEVSSHGLDQKRSANVDFNVAVLTNFTRDHLDYHGDINSYKQAKKKLFAENAEKTFVLNIDDDLGAELYSEYGKKDNIWLYGLTESKARQSHLYVYASHIRNETNGTSFMLHSSMGESDVNIQLIGEFNVYNALACFSVLLENNINFNIAIRYIEKLSTVPGRMELIVNAQKPSVVIDYAHTPEALNQALINVRKHTNGKVICVFGCGGDRDAGKRPLMGEVAESLSDLIFITNDNPRTESPENIIDDIKQGLSNPVQLIVEMDREKAIQQAISLATKNDLILIAGKGHEQYQIIKNQKNAFSDKDIALQALGIKT